MWTKQRRSSITIDSLYYKCLRKLLLINNENQFCSTTKIFYHKHDHRTGLNCSKCVQIYKLPIDIKQGIIEFILNKKIIINIDIIINLLENGGVRYLDLWQLIDLNEYKSYEIKKLIQVLSLNNQNLIELTLGGQWMYDDCLYQYCINELFIKSKFSNLLTLRIQQLNQLNDLLSVFNSCKRLNIFDICQPSLVDRDLININCSLSLDTIKQIKIPSSIRNGGLIKLIRLFPQLISLKICRIDYVLDHLDENNSFNVFYNQDNLKINKQKIKSILFNLISLTITSSINTDELLKIIALCPNIQQLSIQLNDDLNIERLIEFKKLNKLRIINETHNRLIFEEKLVKLIKMIGKNLEHLYLDNFDIIDLNMILNECVNMKNLSIQYFQLINFNLNQNQHYLNKVQRKNIDRTFNNLINIRLRPSIEGKIGNELVKYLLLKSINIEHLELYLCHNLNDLDLCSVIKEKKNYFLHLKSLIIKNGHSLTKEKVQQLVKHSVYLQFIDIGKPLINKLTNIDNDLFNHPLFE